jgi:uncharacterized membrane protein YeaQ/YmgE (transglycosylase-associated protein family)
VIGMHFVSFLTLAIISLIAGLVVHYAISYRALNGFDGFLTMWVAGWVGGWLGSPVLGHWFAAVNIGEVFIIPALIGALIGAFVPAAMLKAEARTRMAPVLEVHKTQHAA